MTQARRLRTLPLRVPVMAGESLDSWLEALARRNGLSISRLLPSVGWRKPGSLNGLVAGVSPQVLRRIEHQAGLPSGRLDDAVLDRYLPAAPPRWPGSRYCPGCLTGSEGRWPLAWRLPWVFACTSHRILLCDTCPGCGAAPRTRGSRTGLNPVACCPNNQAGGICCAADLRAVTPRRLARRGRMLAAQEWITAVLGSGGHSPPSPGQALSDLDTVAHWALRRFTAADFASFGTHVQRAWQDFQHEHGARRAALYPPADAALAGAAATTAFTVLAESGAEACAAIRALAGQRPALAPVRPPGMPQKRWAGLSAPAQARFLRALDPALPPIQRLRYRSGTPLACLPGDSAGLLGARAGHIPQALWPGWTIRLMPPGPFKPRPFRSTVAACLLLPGNPALTGQAVTQLHGHRSQIAINGILRPLAAHGDGDVLAAITYLAAYLDAHGSPIDYQRRRTLIHPGVITAAAWQDLCGRAGAHPGEARLLDARRYLYQLLTGADLHDPRHQLAFRTGADLTRYYEFSDSMTTPLRVALHSHAACILDRHDIDEPLTWEPPASCAGHLALPGRDPVGLDPAQVRQLVHIQQLPVGVAAHRLGTSSFHIRYALESVPRPARPWGPSSPPAAWLARQKAAQVLTREFFEREYLQAGKRLRQIADETGLARPLVAEHAHQAGVTLASSPPTAAIDGDWLREQYLDRQRPYADIAAELGVAIMTVHSAARRHGIASRPANVHSFPQMIAKLGEEVPPDIRRAVEGGLQGWHRLWRFKAAMAFPTLAAAARDLGAHQSTLVHQFRRLERDVGAKLYHRSSPRQAMRPTSRGAALLRALEQPEIAALAGERTRTG